MTIQSADFQSEMTLTALKFYPAYAAVSAELTAISIALQTDPTVHDLTIETPPPGVALGADKTHFTNAALIVVNKGKGGNLPVTAMQSVINVLLALVTPPANTALPAITGTPSVGSVLACNNGAWTATPTSYARIWLRNGAAIAGATAPAYTLVAADGGTQVSCQVTAFNQAGSTSAVSNPVNIAP